MIKAEVVFDSDKMFVNKHEVIKLWLGNGYGVFIDSVEQVDKTLEQAIAWCLEN